MFTQTLRRFLKAYTAALLVSTTSLLVGSAVTINNPKQIYIPYTGTAEGIMIEVCAVAHDREVMPHSNAGNTGVILAVYRTVAYSGCDPQRHLFI